MTEEQWKRRIKACRQEGSSVPNLQLFYSFFLALKPVSWVPCKAFLLFSYIYPYFRDFSPGVDFGVFGGPKFLKNGPKIVKKYRKAVR